MGANLNKSDTTTKDFTPQAFKNLAPEIAAGIQGLVQGGTSGALFSDIPTPGELSPEMTDAERNALASLGSFSASGGPFSQARTDQLNKQFQGQPNPFLPQLIDAAARPINQAFDERDLEARALFSRAGQSLPESSPFARAQSISNRGRADAIGDVSLGLAAEDFRINREQSARAVDQSLAVDQQQFDQHVANLEAQALPRLIEQFGITAGVDIFNQRLALLAQVLGLGGQLALPTLGSDSSSFGIGQEFI